MSVDVDTELTRELPAVDGVRIWQASLDHGNGVLRRMAGLLSDDEIARVGELQGVPRRNRFIVARGILRLLLGDVTGVSPESIAFAYGRDGKPSIAPRSVAAGVQFNVSHSRDLALFAIAIAGDRRTGIDVEWTEGSAPFDGIATRFFSAAERAKLAEAAPEERRRAFHRIWVRKEAYLKGRGEGISEWIHDTDFSDLPAAGAAPTTAATRDQDRWVVRDVDGLPSGFVASVAVERGDR